jgi:hypothetical protein
VSSRREVEDGKRLGQPALVLEEIDERRQGGSHAGVAFPPVQGAKDALEVGHLRSILRELVHLAADALRVPGERFPVRAGGLQLDPAIDQTGNEILAQGAARFGAVLALTLEPRAIEECRELEDVRGGAPKSGRAVTCELAVGERFVMVGV